MGNVPDIPHFPNDNNNKKVTPDQYDHIHMYSKSKTHSSYLSVKMHLQNEIIFKTSLSSFFLYFVLSFLNMKRTPVLKALTQYSLKIIMGVIHFQQPSKVFISFIPVCMRSFVRFFIHSFSEV